MNMRTIIDDKYLSELCKSYYDLKYSFFGIIEEMCKKEGLTVMQAMMLFLIRSEKSVSVGELSGYLNITNSNASVLCKKLEKDELLSRQRSKTDERTVIITVSEKGSDMLERMLERSRIFSNSIADIPCERLDAILSTINEATELLTRLRPE